MKNERNGSVWGEIEREMGEEIFGKGRCGNGKIKIFDDFIRNYDKEKI